MTMLTQVLEKILILQDRDKRRRDLEAQLANVPKEITAVEAKISSEKGAIDAAKQELKELETQKKLLETEIGSAEQKAAKYRTQQLEVRKNDEYRAIGNEIEHTVALIGQLEEKELGLMYSIDEAKKKFAAAEAVLKGNISGHEERIRNLRERDTNLKAELKSALAELATARQPVEEPVLRLYDRIAQRSFPACVPVRGGKCGGCHLKISSESESAARGKEAKPGTCDQCGRMIWWDAN